MSGFSSGGSGSGVGLTSRDHSRHLGFNQLSGFRKGYTFLIADKLNLLLLLPDRGIFSRWSVGIIAIRAQLGSLTSTFMLIFSATWTLHSNLATLARVAKLVAVEATHRFGLDCRPWSLSGDQKRGVDGDLFSILLHRHPVDLNYTLFLQFRLVFRLRHAGQLTAADDTTWRVQRFVDGNAYWSINESSGLKKTHRLRFPSTLHQERSIPQLFNAFSGQQRATVYSVGGRHSMNPRPETMANCYRSCRSVRYLSPCPNLGRCPVIFCFCLWVPCYVS